MLVGLLKGLQRIGCEDSPEEFLGAGKALGIRQGKIVRLYSFPLLFVPWWYRSIRASNTSLYGTQDLFASSTAQYAQHMMEGQ